MCTFHSKFEEAKAPSTPPFSLPLAGAAKLTCNARPPRKAANASFSVRLRPRRTRLIAVDALSKIDVRVKATERRKAGEQSSEERRLIAPHRGARDEPAAVA